MKRSLQCTTVYALKRSPPSAAVESGPLPYRASALLNELPDPSLYSCKPVCFLMRLHYTCIVFFYIFSKKRGKTETELERTSYDSTFNDRSQGHQTAF